MMLSVCCGMCMHLDGERDKSETRANNKMPLRIVGVICCCQLLYVDGASRKFDLI